MTRAHADDRSAAAPEAQTRAWLQASHLSKEYVRKSNGTTTVALHDVSLGVDESEFVSLVGPSGCGKTTFLKILDGLIEPTGGEILLRGRPIMKDAQDRAMVFQEASLFPWFTVARNVGFGLECQGLSKDEAQLRAMEFIELVGLSGFDRHFPHELSGGMQQRANLARALTVQPFVLLMDEPFAALDSQTRELMQAELLRIWSEAMKTVVFVTHQIEEAVYLSDRVIVMSPRPGRIVADISIDLPRPRGLDVKRSPEFHAYEDQIWHLIRSQGTDDELGLIAAEHA